MVVRTFVYSWGMSNNVRLALATYGVLLCAALPMLGCPEPAPNGNQCDITPGTATETRTLEIGSNTLDDATSTLVFTPFVDEGDVERVAGDQGLDMVVVHFRFPALPEDASDELCMLIHYERSGRGGSSFTVRLRFERQGEYWVSSALFDPIDGVGILTLEATAENRDFSGSAVVSVLLVNES